MNPLYNAVKLELKKTIMIYLYAGKVNSAMLEKAKKEYNTKKTMKGLSCKNN